MNYGDHNFTKITQQTMLRVALVTLVVSSQSSRAVRQARQSTQPKCMGSNVSSRDVTSQVEFGLYQVRDMLGSQLNNQLPVNNKDLQFRHFK